LFTGTPHWSGYFIVFLPLSVAFTFLRQRTWGVWPAVMMAPAGVVLAMKSLAGRELSAQPYFHDWAQHAWAVFSRHMEYPAPWQVVVLVVVSVAVLWGKRSSAWLFVLAGALATWVSLNQNVVSGVSIENDHFYQAAGPVLTLGWLVAATRARIQGRFPLRRLTTWSAAPLAVLVLLDVGVGARVANLWLRTLPNKDGTDMDVLRRIPSRAAKAALAGALPRGTAVCGAGAVGLMAPLFGWTLVHFQRLPFWSPMPTQEVALRRALCFALGGGSAAALEQAMAQDVAAYQHGAAGPALLRAYQDETRQAYQDLAQEGVALETRRLGVQAVLVDVVDADNAARALQDALIPFERRDTPALVVFKLGPVAAGS